MGKFKNARLKKGIKMKNLKYILIVLLSISGFSLPHLDLTKSQNKLTYLMIGNPSALRIRAEVSSKEIPQPLTGVLNYEGNKVKGNVKLKLLSFDTGMEIRNNHMKKHLEVEKFPETDITLTDMKSEGEGSFTGELNLHGVKKPITGKMVSKKDGKKVSLEYKFTVLMSDFNIHVPSFMGITMKDEVELDGTVEGELED